MLAVIAHMNLLPKENIDLVGINIILVVHVIMTSYILVFVSPEVAVRSPWRNIFNTPLFKKHLALVAVDEAHCIPEW